MIAAPAALLAVLYAGGYLAQFIGNYEAWKQGAAFRGTVLLRRQFHPALWTA